MNEPQVDYTNTPPLFPPPGFSTYGEDKKGYWIELVLGSAKQRFRWIHRGRFMMGSPEDEPQREGVEHLHWVSLSTGFWLAETACTQGFWREVTGENPSYFSDKSESDNLPVEYVNWDDCQAMIAVLNQRMPELKARLPTEAEWEYACRAGTTTPFSFGETLTTALANFDGNYPYNGQAKGEFREQTLPVDTFAPNPWGLYQMHGNVWEWCEDWYEDYPQDEAIDPKGPPSGSTRVLRGGSWDSYGGWLRSADRSRFMPDVAGSFTGLRLALG